MKTTRHPRRRIQIPKPEELRRIILTALSAPVPPRLKTWVRI